MSGSNMPMLPQALQQVMPSTKAEDQLGMTLEQFAAARVSAVEEHLLSKQEVITSELSELKLQKEKLQKEKDTLSKDWQQKKFETEVGKAESEVAKLPFGNVLKVEGLVRQDEKDADNQFKTTIIITLASKLEHNSNWSRSVTSTIDVKHIKISPTKTEKKAILDIEKKIDAVKDVISEKMAKIEKISDYLSNIEREERKARAMIVQSKLKSMDRGEEFMTALLSNMPEI